MATPNEIVVSLVMNELFPRLEKYGVSEEQNPVSPVVIAYLAKLKSMGEIDTHSIRQILDRFFDSSGKA